MTGQRFKEQYDRCERYLSELLAFRDEGFEHRRPDDMSLGELKKYGLNAADREKMRQWLSQLPPNFTRLGKRDLAPVADILGKWIAAGIEPPELLDSLYTFFQHCYHLKDWIKNDPSCPLRTSVENFVSASPQLSLCADICNGSKHLNLTKPPRSGHKPIVGGVESSMYMGKVTIEKVSVQHGRNFVNAFELAEKCMAEWKAFLGL